MNHYFSSRLIGASFWLAPLLMFASDLLRILDDGQFNWVSSILFWLSFYVFLFLIIGMLQLAEHTKFATIAAIIASFGALIGPTIIGMSRMAWGVVREGVDIEVISAADANPWVFFTSRFPGITFPIGLILLAVALRRRKVINGYLLAGLIVSIVLFPLGRIPKELLVNVVGDALMIIFFGMVGRAYAAAMSQSQKRDS